MKDETMWEVWARIDTKSRWFRSMAFDSYKEAKSYYDLSLEVSSFMFCIVRAETHRSIVLEDLRGNLDD